jgi:glyoxylase-like metal-dependent hydrolase (beta-lactamase superfamily II)
MASKVELRRFSVGSMDNNVYILVDPETQESVLFDAPTNAQRILEELKGTSLNQILMTHSDPDHVQALQEVRTATNAPVAVHPADAAGLPAPADRELSDGEVISIGSVNLKGLHTPGHTPGSMSFVTEDIVIAGDTLFPGGPGNTNRDQGDFEQIIESIRSKLFTLPDETTVYPGHGKPTTIGAERPHLQQWIDRGW